MIERVCHMTGAPAYRLVALRHLAMKPLAIGRLCMPAYIKSRKACNWPVPGLKRTPSFL